MGIAEKSVQYSRSNPVMADDTEMSDQPLEPVSVLAPLTAGSNSDGPKSELTQPVVMLIEEYVQGLNADRRNYTPIHVDEIASRVAKFYELIRKVVDWKDDNALRRGAIERTLKRLLFSKLSGLTFIENVRISEVAETLTMDLIRGGHLPNDAVPKERIVVIERALGKYLYFLEHTSYLGSDPSVIKTRINYFTSILEIAACEIEEILTNPVRENGLINAMTRAMDQRIRIVPEGGISDDEKAALIYISVCRTLFDLDDAFISYHLLVFQYPQWTEASQELVAELNRSLPSLRDQLGRILTHPMAKEFYGFCERFDTVFALVGDILEDFKDNPAMLLRVFQDKAQFTREIEKHYDKRYSTLKKRLFRLAVFSTLSVFLSNWVTFFIIEVPLANVFAEGFNLFTAFIDFLVPTVIMFLLVTIIRPPKDENRKNVLKAVYSFVYAQAQFDYYEIHVRKPRRPLVRAVMGTAYTLITIAIFYGVAYIFWFAGLPITSVAFDTFTIALTVFAAVSIRNKAKELSVDDKASFREFFLDMISVPIAKIGSVFAAKWKEYNVVAFLFTFIIETPFAVIVDLIEQWSLFLKERRAEIR
ncbi:hypothetical protein A2Z33_06490 [Candidatus Gottesmanbacteria bacterium RBG_16_52_11]|uniref:Uncharacterized protein n=1 Tax=Candidatus Gottesmanbacteria bacterium RBG_16_52_11 TaxID=1798374 RepID=A0A1F5YXJ4_9BACT|nr:MAG: hypothetical protein A2Z33_06490 [Candidatus Gottesmanbacteria bacterium RBG_16_52_11]